MNEKGKGEEMMKKINIVTLVTIVAILLASCGQQENAKDVTIDSAYQKGLEVVALLDEMAGNDDYIQIYTAGEEIRAILEEVGAGDHTSPKAVYEITLVGEMPEDMIALLGGDVTLAGMS